MDMTETEKQREISAMLNNNNQAASRKWKDTFGYILRAFLFLIGLALVFIFSGLIFMFLLFASTSQNGLLSILLEMVSTPMGWLLATVTLGSLALGLWFVRGAFRD